MLRLTYELVCDFCHKVIGESQKHEVVRDPNYEFPQPPYRRSDYHWCFGTAMHNDYCVKCAEKLGLYDAVETLKKRYRELSPDGPDGGGIR